jgi:hypothetical protein
MREAAPELTQGPGCIIVLVILTALLTVAGAITDFLGLIR